MRKSIILIALLFATAAYGNIYVNGVDLNVQKVHYIKLEISYVLDRTLVYVDYGQDETEFRRRVTDESGDKRYFVSVADVLNTFYENDWRLIETYTVPGGGNENTSIYGTTHYILERMSRE